MHRLLLLLLPFVAIALIATLAPGQPSSLRAATTFTPDTFADGVDIAHGDGVCATVFGACSLRAAVQEANALAGADAINLPDGTYSLTIAPVGTNDDSTGDLNITDDLSISGMGLRQQVTTIVDGGGLDRVFDIDDPVSVELQLFTITNGAARNGGAIKITDGDVALDEMRLIENAAQGTGNPTGGAIFSTSVLSIEDSLISGNTAEGSGGGIWNDGALDVLDSSIISNVAGGDGGGLRNGDAATLNGSIVSSNSAAGATGGGGVYNTSGATLTVDQTVLGFNTAEAGDGGGLRLSGGATLTDSTVSNNSTIAGNGGGLHVTGSATLDSVTLSGNTSSGNGGGATVASGGDALLNATNSTMAKPWDSTANTSRARVVLRTSSLVTRARARV